MRAMLTPSCGIARQIQPARNQEHCCVLTAWPHAVHDRHDLRGNPDQTADNVVAILARSADFAARVLLAFRRWLFARPAGLAFCGHCVFPVCCVESPGAPKGVSPELHRLISGVRQSVHIANCIALLAACIRASSLVWNEVMLHPAI